MLRWPGLILTLLLGGCLAAAPPPVPEEAPAGSGPTAAPARQIPPPSAAKKTALQTKKKRVDVSTWEEPVALDPETLEDNRVLASADQDAPDLEGESVEPQGAVFDFPVVENAKVRYYIDYYTGPGKGAFGRWLRRSGRFIPLMRPIFREEGLPEDLAYLAMVESGFNNRAYSWAHAAGPWQFIESTAKGYGLESNWWFDERRDFEKSTRAAAQFLSELHDQFDGDWYLAVAGYNAGAGKIRGAIRKYGTRDFWELSRGDYLQAETRNYVPKLLAALIIAREPEKYGFDGIDLADPIEFDTVEIPTATDLEVVAGLCGVEYDEIKDLNPELMRWCTPPDVRNYRLRLPAGTADSFLEGFAQIPAKERANYKRHRIQSGDTLLKLAQRYNIRVEDITALNGISNPKALKIGADLILPLKKGYSSLPVDELVDDYDRTTRRSYTVRSGDSLWTIARRFDVTEKELRVWNRLGWSNVIRPGQTLVVSSRGAKGANKAASRQDVTRKVVYKVRSGDTLWGIGRQFSVKTSQILAWNNLEKNHVLRPGDKLTLMVPASKG